MSTLDRYRQIIADWDAFTCMSLSPLPTSFWINHLRIQDEVALSHLAEAGIAVEKISWTNHAYRTDANHKLGLTWLYRAGLIQVMEEVSMIPPMLMECQPGERILDLCAAPGNKTIVLAGELHGRGALIANEFNRGRLAILRGHIERLGIPGVTTFQHNGTNLNRNFGLFDRILCDVPCSCEGTHRKHAKEITWGNPEFRARLTSTQRALLRKALQLCKVGGRIVYSTCTYAPEENEMVIDAILKEYPGICKVLPVKIPGFHLDQGLQEWDGVALDSQMQNCIRVYPHKNNTGGFFVAVLEKQDTLPAWTNVVDIPPERISQTEEEQVSAQESTVQMCTHFGIPESNLGAYEFFHKGGDLFGVSQSPRLPLEPEPDSCGIMFLRKTINHPKMPTGFSNLLAPYATRMVIELDAVQRDAYMSREKLEMAESQLACCPEDGYVMVRFQGIGIGQATLDRRKGTPLLHSLFPKS